LDFSSIFLLFRVMNYSVLKEIYNNQALHEFTFTHSVLMEI